MRETQRVLYLLVRYKANSLNQMEREELDHWKNENVENETLFDELLDQVNEREAITELLTTDTEASLKELKLRMAESKKPTIRILKKAIYPVQKKFRIAIAASVLFFLSVISLFYFQSKEANPPGTPHHLSSSQIVPGGNKAMLTLSDGSVINLDDVLEGTLANHQGIEISKTADGQLIYRASGSPSASKSETNTISTPLGGQYQVILPDGTKVWLNSSSSLSYPVVFEANERKVRLDGEAYFDVTTALTKTNDKVPFIIELDKQQYVEVLGTELNVHAYKEENNSKTTLIEGRVNIRANGTSVSLNPGQQAQVNQGENGILVSEVQTAGIVAWKNGYFHFEDETIQEIMVKIARWYDVDVIYRGNMPDDGFGGIVSRFDNVSELLNILELTGKVHFKVEGRRITVMP